MDLSRLFNCNGKVNQNDWHLCKTSLFLSDEMKTLFSKSYENFVAGSEIKLFNFNVPASTAIFNLKHLTMCMQTKIKFLCRYERYRHTFITNEPDQDIFFLTRHMICELILYIRAYMRNISWNYKSIEVINYEVEMDILSLFSYLKSFCNRLKNIPDSVFHHVASNLGNKSSQPDFHIFHLHLELRWYLITLLYDQSKFLNYLDLQIDELEKIHATVINDLIYISLKMFEKFSLADLQQKTPYSCTCVRELWLMLQVYLDYLADSSKLKSFWEHVNQCVSAIFGKETSMKDQWTKAENPVECNNSELFCIWLLQHLSLLYGYNTDGVYLTYNSERVRSNHEQMEKVLKSYINKHGKDGKREEIDAELKIIIPLLRTLILEWWKPQVQIVSLLWECFHRRLNQPFLIRTSGPWTISIEKKTSGDILKEINDRIFEDVEQKVESSYGMFLRLLGKFLIKNYDAQETKYWNQIKSRIYSKFSKNKVQEFSEPGLYNFFSLFFTLAITADTANVCSVMMDLLPPIQDLKMENHKKYSLIWKSKLIVLLLYNKFKMNFIGVAESFLEMVNIISCRKDDISRSMMSDFVEVLSTVLCSGRELGLRDEYIFIGGWIDRYLLECPKTRMQILLKTLLGVMEKCFLGIPHNNKGVKKMLDALWSNVASRLRTLIFDPITPGDYYKDLAELAVSFTLNSIKEPVTAKRHSHSTISFFQHFTSSIIIKDIRITRYYLKLILDNTEAIGDLKSEIKNFDLVLVQAWIKCSFLACDCNKFEITILQEYAIGLDKIKNLLGEFDLCDITNSSEPIMKFMECCMQKRNNLKTENERAKFDAECKIYFHNLEKWILSPISEESKDSELSLWIYRCIASLIFCCSPILYTKNQPNNMLRVLINKVALPAEKSPQLFVRHLAKRIFSMILLGIENLSFRADITLQALVRDLFDQYIPLLITDVNNADFKISEILLKCFEDSKTNFSRLMFEMLMANFFIVSTDNMMHKYSYLAMILFKKLIVGGKVYASHVTEHIINICMQQIMNCYVKVHDHHPHKKHTLELICEITKNSYYKENNTLREKLKSIVLTVVQRYLTVNPKVTFELLRSLCSINIELTENLVPYIENFIINLEQNRRPNAASLRYSWTQIQALLQTASFM
ncbi:protein MMS22-like isoform X2 [Prorops nasuta]|uniref:protein MMS22-like isoform X2 n=1 Tax=Prorops nasuta TaxID=863751 RepID=UPI0034CF30BA